VPLGRVGGGAGVLQPFELAGQVLPHRAELLQQLGHLALGDVSVVAHLGELLLPRVQLALHLGQRLPAHLDLLLHQLELLLVGGLLLVRPPPDVGGVLLRLGQQRGGALLGLRTLVGQLGLRRGQLLVEVTLGVRPPVADLPLHSGPPLRQLLMGGGPGGLGLLLRLRPRRLDQRLHLRARLLGPLGSLLVDLPGRLHAAFVCGLARGPDPLGEVAGVGECPLRLGLQRGGPLRGRVDQQLALLFGELQDLVDHRAEVAERRLLQLPRPITQVGQLGVQLGELGPLLVQLPGEVADLRGGLVALPRDRGQPALRLGDEPVDLPFVVATQGDLEPLGRRALGRRDRLTTLGHAHPPNRRAESRAAG
jgi:hypothetical protein